jgi:CheY-like chemotaxis protein
MVHGYARQSGGVATIYSELGHGTQVRLYLPRRHDKPATSGIDGESRAPVSTGHERILVVEDKDDVRKMAVVLLDSLGYRTVATDNAATALDLLNDGAEFDLLFTDIMMPGEMNGIDLAGEVRRRFPLMPIVFTSGFSNPERTHADAAALGATIISKPYRKTTLAESLRAALAARRDAA